MRVLYKYAPLECDGNGVPLKRVLNPPPPQYRGNITFSESFRFDWNLYRSTEGREHFLSDLRRVRDLFDIQFPWVTQADVLDAWAYVDDAEGICTINFILRQFMMPG